MLEAPRNFNPHPYPYHTEIELRIETLTNLGSGLGRDGEWVVFVPFALPGENVRVRIFRNHARYSEADLVEIIEPSPERVKAPCPLFGICGGCQYQHLSQAGQLRWKRDQVAEALRKIGGIEAAVNETHPSPRQYGYRSKLTPHYPNKKAGDFPIGFLKVGRRNAIVDVPHCPIATDNINAALPKERERLRAKPPKGKKAGTVLLRDVAEGVVTDPKAVVTERVGRRSFQFLAGEFFQNNPFILPDLVAHVIAEAKRPETRFLVDAYCGVGMFALCAADEFESVRGVEVSAAATQWANANATINHIHNARFIVGKAEEIFAGLDIPGNETAMIIDPPRAGCDEAFLQQLIAFAPHRVVYVSCDPSTQARDLKFLTAAGFVIEKVQPFDLFPQTRHIEDVVTLSNAALN